MPLDEATLDAVAEYQKNPAKLDEKLSELRALTKQVQAERDAGERERLQTTIRLQDERGALTRDREALDQTVAIALAESAKRVQEFGELKAQIDERTRSLSSERTQFENEKRAVQVREAESTRLIQDAQEAIAKATTARKDADDLVARMNAAMGR